MSRQRFVPNSALLLYIDQKRNLQKEALGKSGIAWNCRPTRFHSRSLDEVVVRRSWCLECRPSNTSRSDNVKTAGTGSVKVMAYLKITHFGFAVRIE